MFKIVMKWSDFVSAVILAILIIICSITLMINYLIEKFKNIGGKNEKQKENAKTYGSR